jgi:hypothetical protein
VERAVEKVTGRGVGGVGEVGAAVETDRAMSLVC